MKDFLSSFILLFASTTLLLGQGEHRAAILGHVTDPSASAVISAQVTIINVQTNVVTELKTDQQGYYEAPLLLAGTYRMEVAARGFRSARRPEFNLPVGSRVEINFPMELGAVSDSVTVTDTPPLLNADNASAGLVLEQKAVRDLPVPGGNSLQLAWFAAGAFTTLSIADRTGSLHSGGPANTTFVFGKVGGNDFTIDGISNAANNRGTAFTPANEFVQAVKIETSGFDASFGHSTGAAISLQTNSGTNRLHGTLREQHEQYSWRAVDLFTKQAYYTRINTALAAGDTAGAQGIRNSSPQVPGRRNDFGFSIGGPVILPKIYNGKDKLFFFFGWAGFRATEYRQSYLTFPTTSMRGGDFSQLLNINATNYQIYDPYSTVADATRAGHVVRTPFAGNIVPKSRVINPTYNFLSSFLPTPNVATAANVEPTNNYIAYSILFDQKYHQYINRVDYNLSSRDRFFARWGYSRWENTNPSWYQYASPDISKGSAAIRRDISAGADWVHTFSPHTLLDVAAGTSMFQIYNELPALGAGGVKPSTEGYPAYMDSLLAAAPNLPTVSWGGWTGMSVPVTISAYWVRVVNAKADLSHMRGKHTLKTGIDVRGHYQTGNAPGANTGTFSYSSAYTQRTDDGFGAAGTGNYGGSWTAFMMGLPTTASVYKADDWAFANPYYGMYVHDTWRVNSRLTLNFGLRVEYELGPTERYNRVVGGFDRNATLPITAAATAFYAANPIPEVPASQFSVAGGATYPGTGGLGRNFWSNSLSVLPRFAAAYQLGNKTVLRGGYGMFMDTLNVMDYAGSFNQLGYTWTQTTPVTTDFGRTWLIGNPTGGVSPITDPFPVRSDGTRFDNPPRNALGAMAPVGRGFASIPFDRPHARQNRWRLDLQRQLTANMMITVGYAGSYSDRLPVTQTLAALPAAYSWFGNTRNDTVANNLNANVPNPYYIGNFSGLASSNAQLYSLMSSNTFFATPTIRKSALLGPFSQMNGLTETVAKGKVKTHELDLSFQRNMSKGLSVSVAYARLYNYTADYFPNPFDTSPAWEPSNLGQPHRLTTAVVAELPFGKGRAWINNRGILSWLVGGYQIASLAEYQPGNLLTWPSTTYYRGTDFSGICGGPHTMTQWFNTDGFVTTPALAANTGQARVFPNIISGYGGCRADSMKHVNATVQRTFQVKERFRVEVRWDVYNVLNHGQLATPTTTSTSTNFGKVTGAFLSGDGTPNSNRDMRLQARILF